MKKQNSQAGVQCLSRMSLLEALINLRWLTPGLKGAIGMRRWSIGSDHTWSYIPSLCREKARYRCEHWIFLSYWSISFEWMCLRQIVTSSWVFQSLNTIGFGFEKKHVRVKSSPCWLITISTLCECVKNKNYKHHSFDYNHALSYWENEKTFVKLCARFPYRGRGFRRFYRFPPRWRHGGNCESRKLVNDEKLPSDYSFTERMPVLHVCRVTSRDSISLPPKTHKFLPNSCGLWLSLRAIQAFIWWPRGATGIESQAPPLASLATGAKISARDTRLNLATQVNPPARPPDRPPTS